MMTGWRSTGYAWTPKAAWSSKRSWGPCPRPEAPGRARTCDPATGDAATRWSRSAGALPPPVARRRPRPRPRCTSPSPLADLQARTGAGTCLGTGRLLARAPSARRPATRPSSRSCWAPAHRSWTSGGPGACSRQGSCTRCGYATRGCTIPGCATPPLRADAHHITHWADGGATALTNAALLARHHTIAHQRG